MADNQIVSEIKDKYDRDGALGFLDIEDDVERLLPGPTEEERNSSRLNKVITGESRPLSHTAKEASAWTISNGIPIVAGVIKGANVVGKGTKGLKALNEVPENIMRTEGFSGAVKWAEENAAEAAKKLAEETARREAYRPKTFLGKVMKKAGQGMDSAFMKATKNASRSKDVVDNIATALKAMSAHVPGLPRDLINQYGLEKGSKMLIGLMAALKAGKLIANTDFNGGDYNKGTEDVRGFDPRLEMNIPQKGWQFLKSLVDLDDLNPKNYPMDTINNLLVQFNADAGKWDRDQIDGLSDSEKVKMIKDIAKGKYNETEDLSALLLKNYLELTNTDED